MNQMRSDGAVEVRSLGGITKRARLCLFASLLKFDRDWYLTEYPDVRVKGVNPAEHYLSAVHRRGSQPVQYPRIFVPLPDVLAEGTNPLLHFVCMEQQRAVLLGVGCKGMRLRTQQLMIELADVLDRCAKDLLTAPMRRAAVADNCLPIGNGTCLIQPYPAHEAESPRYTRDHARLCGRF
jgi:hypothetical protein